MLGGWISDTYSWPWIFYINVPIGLIAAWFSWRVYKDRESPTRHLPVDKIGLALLVVWVGALQIMLDKGQELDWFSSSTVVALAIVSVVAFVFFLIWELTEAHPIVDLRLFTYRNFTVGVVVLSVAFAIYFANVVLLPLWLQRFMHYTATDAGWATAPVGIFAILLMPLIGRLLATHDPRKMVTFSFMVFAIVSFMRANFSTGADMQTIIWPTLIQGIATATFFVPLTAISMSGLEPGRIPAASGLSNFARLTAGAFGTSITTTLWDDRASFHHARLTEAAVPGTPGFDHASSILQSLGMTQQQILAYLDQQIEIQSFTLSVLDIYYASALIFLLLTGAIWFARPR
jgi:DHA2 family multidrug resistance protein